MQIQLPARPENWSDALIRFMRPQHEPEKYLTKHTREIHLDGRLAPTGPTGKDETYPLCCYMGGSGWEPSSDRLLCRNAAPVDSGKDSGSGSLHRFAARRNRRTATLSVLTSLRLSQHALRYHLRHPNHCSEGKEVAAKVRGGGQRIVYLEKPLS
jgi:hypothetical protein